MYSFLKEGEFLQINLEKNAVTGYISHMGDSDSDHGVFLDQFFARADIQGHDVSFTTRPLHSMWYEFKGKFDRGAAKGKTDDGYYILRGTLKEFSTNSDKTVSASAHARWSSNCWRSQTTLTKRLQTKPKSQNRKQICLSESADQCDPCSSVVSLPFPITRSRPSRRIIRSIMPRDVKSSRFNLSS